jgi:hypothetical protein
MTKINPITYYVHDCILRGWRNVGYAFHAWSRVMRSDYSAYDIFDDNKFPYTPEEKVECTIKDFWGSLEDDIYPKEFLEYLLELAEGVHNGTIKTTPFDLDRLAEFGEIDE